jgi:hypothetical protein
LSRSGWEVLVLPPTGRLRDAWQRSKNPLPELTGSSR